MMSAVRAGALQRAAADGVESKALEQRRRGVGLGLAGHAERHVAPALATSGAVPIGLAVAQEPEGLSRQHRSRLASRKGRAALPIILSAPRASPRQLRCGRAGARVADLARQLRRNYAQARLHDGARRFQPRAAVADLLHARLPLFGDRRLPRHPQPAGRSRSRHRRRSAAVRNIAGAAAGRVRPPRHPLRLPVAPRHRIRPPPRANAAASR